MEKSKRYIGCCGAHCKTCKQFRENLCKGCKLGYDTNERNIDRAKCKIKLCCFKYKKYETCADCNDFITCEIVDCFYKKSREKYRKSIHFIQNNGYQKFIDNASSWKDASGRLPK